MTQYIERKPRKPKTPFTVVKVNATQNNKDKIGNILAELKFLPIEMTLNLFVGDYAIYFKNNNDAKRFIKAWGGFHRTSSDILSKIDNKTVTIDGKIDMDYIESFFKTVKIVPKNMLMKITPMRYPFGDKNEQPTCTFYRGDYILRFKNESEKNQFLLSWVPPEETDDIY